MSILSDCVFDLTAHRATYRTEQAAELDSGMSKVQLAVMCNASWFMNALPGTT